MSLCSPTKQYFPTSCFDVLDTLCTNAKNATLEATVSCKCLNIDLSESILPECCCGCSSRAVAAVSGAICSSHLTSFLGFEDSRPAARPLLPNHQITGLTRSPLATLIPLVQAGRGVERQCSADCSFTQKSPDRGHAAAAVPARDKMWIISSPG